MHNLGNTRSANRRDHLLLTPDTFVRTPLPGMQGGTAVVHVSPAAGAAFTQYTAELEPAGTLGPTAAQRFVFVLSGAADLATDTTFHALAPCDYAYIPPGLTHTLTAQGRNAPCRHRKDVPASLDGVAAPISARRQRGEGHLHCTHGRHRSPGARPCSPISLGSISPSTP